MKISPLASKVASLCLCAPLFTSPFVVAQDNADEAVELTVSYAANRFEQPKTSVLASIDVIEREEIEKLQADSAFDVLNTLPGVEIVPAGTKGNSAAGIFLRGTKSAQTLILVNGVRVNKPTSGTASIGLIPAFAIERIEVVRGPRAAIYGSDAMGGVISITTTPATQKTEHQIELVGGSNNYNLQGWKSAGQISDKTYGHFVVSNESDKGYDSYSSGDDEQYGYSSQSFFGGIEHQFNNQWLLSLNAQYQDNRDEFQGYTAKEANNEKIVGSAAALQYTNDVYSSTLSLNYTSSKSATAPVDNSAIPSKFESKRNSVSWLHSYLATDWLTVNGGLDYYKEYADQFVSYAGNFDINSRDNTGVYVTALADYNSVLAEASVRHDDSSAYGGNTTWNAALGYYFSELLTVSASYGTAFVAPTFADLYYPGPSFPGNPDLKPQESESAELTFKGAADWLTWSATAYNTKIKDLIQVGSSIENIDNATIKGVELSLGFTTGPVVHKVGVDLKDPVNEADGTQLIRRAKENYSWTANYEVNKFNFVAIANYTGDRKDTDFVFGSPTYLELVDLDAYLKVDLGVDYLFTPNLKGSFKIDNLFDEEYAYSKDDFGGYLVGQERSFYAGVNYKF